MKNSQSLISVIIPCFNIENKSYLLEDALISVLNQTYQNFEILIIDDGSSDSTPSIVESLLAKYKNHVNKITFHRLTINSGPSIARNEGIMLAKGEYLCFLDWDDLFINDYFQTAMTYFQENVNSQLVVSPTYYYCTWKAFEWVYISRYPKNINELCFEEMSCLLFEKDLPMGIASAIICEKEIFDNDPELLFDNYLSKLTAEDILFFFGFLAKNIRPHFLPEAKVICRTFLGYNSRSQSAKKTSFELEVFDHIHKKAKEPILLRISEKFPERALLIKTKIERSRKCFILKKQMACHDYLNAIKFLFKNKGFIKLTINYFILFAKYLDKLSMIITILSIQKRPQDPTEKYFVLKNFKLLSSQRQ